MLFDREGSGFLGKSPAAVSSRLEEEKKDFAAQQVGKGNLKEKTHIPNMIQIWFSGLGSHIGYRESIDVVSLKLVFLGSR